MIAALAHLYGGLERQSSRKRGLTMPINSISDFRKAMRHGPYAWPGGYPCYFLMSDGEAMSFKAAKENIHEMLSALRDMDNSGWRPLGLEINYEDGDLICCQTGERIEAAYVD